MDVVIIVTEPRFNGFYDFPLDSTIASLASWHGILPPGRRIQIISTALEIYRGLVVSPTGRGGGCDPLSIKSWEQLGNNNRRIST
jgi:hypothetical protein